MQRLSKVVAVILSSHLMFSPLVLAAEGREAPAAGAVRVIPADVPSAGTDVLGLKAGQLASPGTIVPSAAPEASVVVPRLDAALTGTQPQAGAPGTVVDAGRAQDAVAPGAAPGETALK